jgi:HK97 family phage major capsid protein
MPTPVPRVASLFYQAGAESGRVSFLRDPGQTPTADAIAEGTAKPELTLVLPQVDATLSTVAVWAGASSQTVEDVAGFTQWINGVFAADIADKLDSEVLNGSGTAPHMLGLLNHTGLAGPITWTAGESSADAIARGIAAVVTKSKRMPDAVVIDPAAYISMLTAKTTPGGDYLSGKPLTAAPMALVWGLPLIPSPAVPSGVAIVGAFQRGGTLYTKGGLRFKSTDSHADWFSKNLVAFLGEIRALVAVQVPGAFCKVDTLPVPTP